MAIELKPADQHVMHQALVMVLATDVISGDRKRAALAKLSCATQTRRCVDAGCAVCPRRGECEALVQEIMATA